MSEPAEPERNGVPPRPPEAEPEPAPRRERPAGSKRTLRDRLENFFAGLSFTLAISGDHHCAGVVARQAPALADAWANLARENKRVEAIIERMLSGGAWGEALLVTAATVIPIAQHHGALPAELPLPLGFGVVPESPDVAEHRQQQERAPRDGDATGGGPPA